MTAQQLTEETYNKLCQLNYARKANDFGEAPNTYFPELDAEVKKAIQAFPKIYIDAREDLMGVDTLDGTQQFYVVQNDLGVFLVDTQGYTYPRYITELIAFDTDDDSQFDYMEGMLRIANDQIFNAAVKNLVGDLLEEGEFHKSDILSFLQYKLDMAFEAATKKV